MVSTSPSYLFPLHNSAPPLSKVDVSHPDDNMTVEEATRGMTDPQKDAWLEKQRQQTKQDINARRGHLGDDHTDKIEFWPDSETSYYNRRITVDEASTKGLTVRELRAVVAHEEYHGKVNSAADSPEEEAAADRLAVRTYGAKTVNSALEKTAKEGHIDPNHVDPGDPHKTVRERQIANIEYEKSIQKEKGPKHDGTPGHNFVSDGNDTQVLASNIIPHALDQLSQYAGRAAGDFKQLRTLGHINSSTLTPPIVSESQPTAAQGNLVTMAMTNIYEVPHLISGTVQNNHAAIGGSTVDAAALSRKSVLQMKI